MKTLFTNIKQLVQVRDKNVDKVSGKNMGTLPIIENAYLLVENDIIVDYGNMAPTLQVEADTVIDASNRIVMPTWCDSHTHIVYAGTREAEFVDRIKGLTYEEIAKRGGGILNSAKRLQETPEDIIYKESEQRLQEVIKLGTGAIEIKSGYGLTPNAELKMLRVIKKLKENYSLPIKATFLGAHAVPAHYKNNKAAYIDEIINKMLPEVVTNNLAEYIDVFCEEGYFSVEDTKKILAAATQKGLIPKIHVNQFNAIGGVQIGIDFNALSVDHLEVVRDQDIEALQNSNTMPVALPSCSFFLGIPYTPGRKIIDAGLPLALATDYNPGSTPSGNMNFVVSTACIKMKLTPEEAINAATINAAYAMGISNTHGSITKGKKANLIVTKPISSYNFIPYAFGNSQVDMVFINGTLFS